MCNMKYIHVPCSDAIMMLPEREMLVESTPSVLTHTFNGFSSRTTVGSGMRYISATV